MFTEHFAMFFIHIDPDTTRDVDGLGRNALMYAVHFGHLDTVQILLEQGIDINCTAHGKSIFICTVVPAFEFTFDFRSIADSHAVFSLKCKLHKLHAMYGEILFVCMTRTPKRLDILLFKCYDMLSRQPCSKVYPLHMCRNITSPLLA